MTPVIAYGNDNDGVLIFEIECSASVTVVESTQMVYSANFVQETVRSKYDIF